MPIINEAQGGLRRYAVFTFVSDDKPGTDNSAVFRLPQCPHTGSLETSVRLQHKSHFFLKRLKSLEKNGPLPFVDVCFYSSYDSIDTMKQMLKPADCVNLYDPSITLHKGCYEEVQLVDPKRDMIQTPIDDEDDEHQHVVDQSQRREPKVQHPPGVTTGQWDDYKKTRGYILLAYKTMEHMYSREFLAGWKTWTGVRYICMQMPKQLGLRRIAFYRQLSCTSDFSYVLLIEVTNLLIYAAQTLNLMDRIKLRLCGYAGIYREADFQVDPVTAQVHNMTTVHKMPPPSSSAGINDGHNGGNRTNNGRSTNADSRETSSNVELLTRLLREQEEAAAKRRQAMDIPTTRVSPPKKRQSIDPPDYAPSPPTNIVAAEIKGSLRRVSGSLAPPESFGAASSAPTDQPKKAPKATPEVVESDSGTPYAERESSMFASTKTHPMSRMVTVSYGQPQMAKPLMAHVCMPQLQPAVRYMAQSESRRQHPHLIGYPTDPSDDRRPIYGNLPFGGGGGGGDVDTIYFHVPRVVERQLPNLDHPAFSQNKLGMMPAYPQPPPLPLPLQYPPMQPPNARMHQEHYNSPVYTRAEWKHGSSSYPGHVTDESMRNLAQKLERLRASLMADDSHWRRGVTAGGWGTWGHHNDRNVHSMSASMSAAEPQSIWQTSRRERSKSVAATAPPSDEHRRRVNFRGHEPEVMFQRGHRESLSPRRQQSAPVFNLAALAALSPANTPVAVDGDSSQIQRRTLPTAPTDQETAAAGRSSQDQRNGRQHSKQQQQQQQQRHKRNTAVQEEEEQQQQQQQQQQKQHHDRKNGEQHQPQDSTDQQSQARQHRQQRQLDQQHQQQPLEQQQQRPSEQQTPSQQQPRQPRLPRQSRQPIVDRIERFPTQPDEPKTSTLRHQIVDKFQAPVEDATKSSNGGGDRSDKSAGGNGGKTAAAAAAATAVVASSSSDVSTSRQQTSDRGRSRHPTSTSRSALNSTNQDVIVEDQQQQRRKHLGNEILEDINNSEPSTSTRKSGRSATTRVDQSSSSSAVLRGDTEQSPPKDPNDISIRSGLPARRTVVNVELISEITVVKQESKSAAEAGDKSKVH